MTARRARWPLILLGFAAVGACWRVAEMPPPSLFAALSAPAGPPTHPPVAAFVSPDGGPLRHAPSLVELGDGRLRAFWYSGSSEGAGDVVISSAVFDPRSGRWSGEQTVVDREQTEAALQRHVKKLGNPVALRDAAGRLHLFYVTVSLGGWAGSSISQIVSNDDGLSWGPARRLITSPFLNVSTLVKGAPFAYADGTIGLPVYHEFLGKFAELLRLDNDGRLLDKQRLTYGRTTLAPVVLVRDAEHAQVLLRHSGAGSSRVMATGSSDGGRHWRAPYALALDNPDAAVAGVALGNGRMLACVNNIEGRRDALSLVVSRDGGEHWQTIASLEDQTAWRARTLAGSEYRSAVDTLVEAAEPALGTAMVNNSYSTAVAQHMCRSSGQCAFEFSYPYLLRATNGDVHLVYTWNRSFIRHRVFKREWLAEQFREVPGAH